jgi:hypothetical protein
MDIIILLTLFSFLGFILFLVNKSIKKPFKGVERSHKYSFLKDSWWWLMNIGVFLDFVFLRSMPFLCFSAALAIAVYCMLFSALEKH